MREENAFFLKAREIASRPVLSVSPAATVAQAAQRMRDRGVSCVLVLGEDEKPLGIITDTDLRNKIVAAGADPHAVRVADIMASPLITIRQDDFILEAIYRMRHHNIHRVAVLDGDGAVFGIITNDDILKLQAGTPHLMIRDIEAAPDFSTLRQINTRVVALVSDLLHTGIRTLDVVHFISTLHDAVFVKAIRLLHLLEFPHLPNGFAFIVLGSEGRMEQTLKTDQDNALVMDDGLGDREKSLLGSFSERLVEVLSEVGVPRCPNDIMASNPLWRRSTSEWKQALDGWISEPTHENILNYSMFSDARTIYGDSTHETRVKDHVRQRTHEYAPFLVHMAKNVLRFPPPVGFFGRLKVETRGEYRGKLDIKKGGIFPITEGIKTLGLQAGFLSGSTRHKIYLLQEAGVLSQRDALDIETSFQFFVDLRLRNQLAEIEAGLKPSNYIDPKQLNFTARARLKTGFGIVTSLQSFLKRHYNLELVSG